MISFFPILFNLYILLVHHLQTAQIILYDANSALMRPLASIGKQAWRLVVSSQPTRALVNNAQHHIFSVALLIVLIQNSLIFHKF
jgi:hypothetical protein